MKIKIHWFFANPSFRRCICIPAISGLLLSPPTSNMAIINSIMRPTHDSTIYAQFSVRHKYRASEWSAQFPMNWNSIFRIRESLKWSVVSHRLFLRIMIESLSLSLSIQWRLYPQRTANNCSYFHSDPILICVTSMTDGNCHSVRDSIRRSWFH